MEHRAHPTPSVPSPLHGERRAIPAPARTNQDGAPHRPLTAADVMKAEEVAALLDVAPTTVYEWARSGALPAFRRGRIVRFRRWEVEAWIAGELDPLAAT